MTPAHNHNDHNAELRTSNRRSLIIALALISGFMTAELIGGIISGSLALLADAGHMLTDAGAIALALLAVWISAKPETVTRTYGYHRAEVLAALLNALSLWAIAGWIIWEAIARLLNPNAIQIQGALMLTVGAIGLGINIAAALVLRNGAKQNLNVEGALKHVLADTMGSIGVILSGLIIITTGWNLIDPILSLCIALLILISSWRLIRKTLTILQGKAPQHLDLHALCQDLEKVPGVTQIHDIHALTITSNYDVLTAHILIDPSHQEDPKALLNNLRHITSQKYAIHHTTLQICHPKNQCPENHPPTHPHPHQNP